MHWKERRLPARNRMKTMTSAPKRPRKSIGARDDHIGCLGEGDEEMHDKNMADAAALDVKRASSTAKQLFFSDAKQKQHLAVEKRRDMPQALARLGLL